MASLFEIPLDESVQVLKRVLPLMSQQRVPTIPQNYAIWYDYVTNRNDELRADAREALSHERRDAASSEENRWQGASATPAP